MPDITWPEPYVAKIAPSGSRFFAKTPENRAFLRRSKRATPLMETLKVEKLELWDFALALTKALEKINRSWRGSEEAKTALRSMVLSVLLNPSVKKREVLSRIDPHWRDSEAMENAVSQLIMGLKSISWPLKNGERTQYIDTVRAITALGETGDARAIEPLLAILWQLPDVKVGDTIRVNLKIFRRAVVIELGKLGKPQATRELIRQASLSTEADAAVEALMNLLERSAKDIGVNELRELANLNATSFHYGFARRWCKGFDKPPDHAVSHKAVDSAQVRQLARQELIRRGLEA